MGRSRTSCPIQQLGIGEPVGVLLVWISATTIGAWGLSGPVPVLVYIRAIYAYVEPQILEVG